MRKISELEIAVLKGRIADKSAKQVADELGVTFNQARKSGTAIKHKLQCEDWSSAYAAAVQIGLIEPIPGVPLVKVRKAKVTLTEKQKQLLYYLIATNNRVIAAKHAGITARSVDAMVAYINNKLGTSNFRAAYFRAVNLGIMKPMESDGKPIPLSSMRLRHQQICMMYRDGLTTKEILEKLGIHQRTIEGHTNKMICLYDGLDMLDVLIRINPYE
jgi:DNA-binding CsgD family transcriptional regulator